MATDPRIELVKLADLFRGRPGDIRGLRDVAGTETMIALHDDGRALLCAWQDGTVVRELPVQAPDGWHLSALDAQAGLLFAEDPGRFSWWRAPAFDAPCRFEGLEGRITCWLELPGGEAIAVGTDRGQVGRWRLEEPAPELLVRLPGSVSFLGLGNARQALIAATMRGTLTSFPLDGRGAPWTVTAPDRTWNWLVADAPNLVLGFPYSNDESALSAWDAAEGALRYTCDLPTIDPGGPSLSPDGRLFAVASGAAEDAMAVINTADGRQVAEVAGHGLRFAFSPDGRYLVDPSYDLQVWETVGFQTVVARENETRTTIAAMAFRHDAEAMALCYHGGPLRIAGLPALSLQPLPAGVTGYVDACAIDPARGRWLTGSVDGIRAWALEPGAPLLSATPPELEPLAFSADGRHLAALTGTTLGLWDVTGGRWVAQIESPFPTIFPIYAQVVAGGQTVVFTGHASGLRATSPIRVWQVGTELEPLTIPTRARSHGALAIDATGTWCAATAAPGQLGVWSLADGTCLASLTSPAEGPPYVAEWRAIAFHPRARRLFAVGRDARVRCWDLDTGALVAERGFPNAHKVALNDDGSLLVIVCGLTFHLMQDLEGPILRSEPCASASDVAWAGDWLAVGPALYRTMPAPGRER